MATFKPARCGSDNKGYAYTFYFQNESATTTIVYWLGTTFSPQPNFPGQSLDFQTVSGSMGKVTVGPGQTSSCNFNTNGQLQAGQPPFLGILGPNNEPIGYVCARFWSGGGGIGDIIGATVDAVKAGVEIVESAMEAEEDPYAAIQSAFAAAQDVAAAAQACASLESDEDQYINFIVSPQAGSGGWVGSENNADDEVATNSINGINMTVRVDGGGVNNPSTQNIYFHYSDDAS